MAGASIRSWLIKKVFIARENIHLPVICFCIEVINSS